MLVAQALGEYGVLAALREGIQTGRVYVEELGREWGLTALGIAVAAAVVWKIFTRVR